MYLFKYIISEKKVKLNLISLSNMKCDSQQKKKTKFHLVKRGKKLS